MLPIVQSILTSIIILAVAFVINGIAKRLIRRVMTNKRPPGQGEQHRIQTLQSLLTNLASYTIFFITIVAILGEFNINASAIIASAGIIGLAIGFGAKDLVSDLVTGFFVLMENQINVGERVTVNGFSGTVEDVGLRVLKIRADNGDLHFIPNRDIKALTNHSRGLRQAEVDIPIPAEADIERAIEVLQKECEQLAKRLTGVVEGPKVLGVQNIGGSEAVIRVLVRTENGQQAEVERELRKDLKKALDHAEL
ncbi:mechanosensitive ion channel family protein [Lihuaxuella thermophila]|uniref:Small conductance mechanosensitive channel n=1 Tax=Lihuaxuella thermophila TaxID=1173111 RepID=A0A1H8H6R0_9BACL|nr:mechanosensitive ion channel family protein [Lihuaxuella thermophila]SEN51447.1 small conductance mechanosensitive channel [Lihuaxuella thermophila]